MVVVVEEEEIHDGGEWRHENTPGRKRGDGLLFKKYINSKK